MDMLYYEHISLLLLMSDNFIRHLVSLLAVLLCVVVYVAGYVSGMHSWWFTSFGLIVVYIITFKIVDAGGGGH